MEESKALHGITEAVDLTILVEEILNSATMGRLSPAAWSGIRLTLKNIRETLASSHCALANDQLNRVKSISQSANGQAHGMSTTSSQEQPRSMPTREPGSPTQTQSNDASKIQVTRKDLRASLERYVDRN